MPPFKKTHSNEELGFEGVLIVGEARQLVSDHLPARMHITLRTEGSPPTAGNSL